MKQKNLTLAVMALCCATAAHAQSPTDSLGQRGAILSESAFTFTEAQLGEDDDMSQNVTIVNSNNNIYASEVGYLFSPVRFRYRAFDQKFNDVYINGVPMNDMETGQFRYSLVGGLNQQTKNQEFALPFEWNNFAMPSMAGANNYNFRPANMPAGHRVTLSGANRNYKVRGMYTYNSGLSNKGWAFSANVTYRWADEGYVEGTFYNSLSYFLGVQKVFGDGTHSLAFSTWGNPTERASQGAGTDEMYWMANDRYYNPYWGYQNGKKRNSRIVNDFAPTALLTWDWNISDKAKLTTSLMGKYSYYKSTKLNYNGADNPHPNYWKNMPSSYYDIWDDSNTSYRTATALENWQTAYDFWSGSKLNRQINWDQLYYSNRQASANGIDAVYYIQAKHNDALTFALSSTFNKKLNDKKNWNVGIIAATNKGMHYQTMEDLLGATTFHNVNTYAIGTYAKDADEVQYDLNHRNGVVKEGDKFGYNYNLLVNNGKLWTSYSETFGSVNYTVAAKVGYTSMQRDGKMRNGMAKDNSYGKSSTANFLDGGFKVGSTINLGRGNTVTLGLGYEHKAPQARVAFVSPEVNNDFVSNLKNERVFSSEIGYQLQNSWLHANISAYYSYLTNVTDWQNFYDDDEGSFTYVSIAGMKKHYYGVEAGLKFKITSAFDIKLIGQMSEAKILNDNIVNYMNSTEGTLKQETLYNKGMRDSGTPLTSASLGLSYHSGGWYVDLNCNYYDRIYLSYSPNFRYDSTVRNRQNTTSEVIIDGDEVDRDKLSQAKGHGGFMLDGSIGRSIYLKRGSLSINLTITNILNNQNIVTGGYESSRSSYSVTKDQNDVVTGTTKRAYKFERNPMKFYAYGLNGMLNIAYKF